MELRPDLDPDEMKKSKGGQSKRHDPKMLCAVILDSSIESPVTITAWAKAVGIPRTTLAGYLPGLRLKGWIATAGEGSNAGQYLTPEGRKAVGKCKEAA
jgi:predicted transcriptional regulator